MSEINSNAANQQAQKKNKRGISNSTKAVSNLKFHEKDAAQNGLFVGHLDSVTVEMSTSANSGLVMPRLSFHFASNHSKVDERRHVYYSIFPAESNVNTIPGGSEEWKVNNVFNWIKHILDVFYLKGRELTQAEEDALTLPFEDYDENFQYLPVDQEEVIAGYKYVFDNAAAMLNGSFGLAEGEVARACYKTADGKPVSCWMKLIRYKKRKNRWMEVAQNGELAFDTFIGTGVVELVKGTNPPAILRLDLARESITPKEVNQAPTIGVPGTGVPGAMGGVMGAAPIGNPNFTNPGFDNTAFNAAGGDMPF